VFVTCVNSSIRIHVCSVSVTSGLRTGRSEDRGSISSRDKKCFSHGPCRRWGHPASYTVGTSSGVRRRMREADHSPTSSAEFKNGGAMPPLPHPFCDVVLDKAQGNFTCTFTFTPSFYNREHLTAPLFQRSDA
jgi:hypothetical protein